MYLSMHDALLIELLITLITVIIGHLERIDFIQRMWGIANTDICILLCHFSNRATMLFL